jgi:hypothetical protein
MVCRVCHDAHCRGMLCRDMHRAVACYVIACAVSWRAVVCYVIACDVVLCRVWWVLVGSGGFWWVPVGSDGFW